MSYHFLLNKTQKYLSLFRYPKIFEDETVGPEAKKLFTEAEVKTQILDYTKQ